MRVAAGDAKVRAAVSAVASLISAGTATTRADLARATSWAPSTVSRHVGVMLAVRLIVERAAAEPRGGRPAIELGLNPDVGVLLSAQIAPERVAVAAADFAGTVLAADEYDSDAERGPQPALRDVEKAFDGLLARLARERRDVLAIAVGLPCPVDHHSGRIVRPPAMPGWDRFGVADFLRESLHVPVLVDNDANIVALGEVWARGGLDEHLLVVEVGTGIGAGIVSRGMLHRGADGTAGEIGHLSLAGHEELVCRCGKTGCVEAVASGWALVRDLREAGIDVATTRDVVRVASEGNAVARRAVTVAAAHIGEVLAGVVSFYNPTTVVVTGELAELQEELLAGIRSVVYGTALPLATRSVRIEASVDGDCAAAIGATRLLQQHLVSADGILHVLTAALSRQ
jgi:predicted NBD/HSP70 family sugar kinase